MAYKSLQSVITNWSRSVYSPCFVYPASSVAEIVRALAAARAARRCVIPHGAGHSYTDAALNTGGVVIDLTPMRRIIAWDPEQGILRAEPGVTFRDLVQATWQDGWWPYVTPSTAEATIGGSAAMNVNGKNAWKCGPFGAHILSLEVLLASGERCTLAPQDEPELFHAFVGGLGLLGMIISITIQLQRISSGYVTLERRSAASFAEIFDIFARRKQTSDFMEAWVDGFAGSGQPGRGVVTCAAFSDSGEPLGSPFPEAGRLETSLASLAGSLARPALPPLARTANRLYAGWLRQVPKTDGRRRLLPRYTFWPEATAAGYHALFPEGIETFQAFVPREHAAETFEQVLRYSQEQGCLPIWCTVKQHCGDPFLLSYQVDGFSLELNYSRTHRTAARLRQTIEHMSAAVVEAQGKFYLAKDRSLTPAQYRRSVGDEALDTFFRLKQSLDPEMLFQSDLSRRLFWPAEK